MPDFLALRHNFDFAIQNLKLQNFLKNALQISLLDEDTLFKIKIACALEI